MQENSKHQTENNHESRRNARTGSYTKHSQTYQGAWKSINQPIIRYGIFDIGKLCLPEWPDKSPYLSNKGDENANIRCILRIGIHGVGDHDCRDNLVAKGCYSCADNR